MIRKYKRDKSGKFSTTGSGGGSSKAKTKAKNKRRGSGQRKRSAAENAIARGIAVANRSDGSGARKAANVEQSDIRRERNQRALQRFRKQGVPIPAGSIKKVAQLKKGGSVKLSNGVVIKRSKTGAYTAVRPKAKPKGKFTRSK